MRWKKTRRKRIRLILGRGSLVIIGTGQERSIRGLDGEIIV